MKIHVWTARILGAVALCTFGCGASIQADVAYAAAHDIESKAGLAQADLTTCKADTTKCEQVDQDLKAVVETSKALEASAVDAGAKPAVAAPTPAPAPSAASGSGGPS